jgi:diamine N-acetyltransferase
MRLVEITKDNWLDVVFLTTNEDGMPTLCEQYVTSNAFSLVQAQYEGTWTTRAIEHEGKIVGFAMYGYSEDHDCYELLRMMIDRKHQGKGLGAQAIRLVLSEMEQMADCQEVYVSTDPDNARSKHLYEKIGFVSTGRHVDGEELYCYRLFRA